MEDLRQVGRFSEIWEYFLKQKNPEHNATQKALTGEVHIVWNEPVVSRANHLHSASLDGLLGSKGRWHLKTDTHKFYTAEVVDKKKCEVF